MKRHSKALIFQVLWHCNPAIQFSLSAMALCSQIIKKVKAKSSCWLLLLRVGRCVLANVLSSLYVQQCTVPICLTCVRSVLLHCTVLYCVCWWCVPQMYNQQMPDFGKYGKHFHPKQRRSKLLNIFLRISRMAERLYINVINMCPTLQYRVHVT